MWEHPCALHVHEAVGQGMDHCTLGASTDFRASGKGAFVALKSSVQAK